MIDIPGVDFKLVGPKYALSGAKLAFHAKDHGLIAVSKESIILHPNTLTRIGISKEKVCYV